MNKLRNRISNFGAKKRFGKKRSSIIKKSNITVYKQDYNNLLKIIKKSLEEKGLTFDGESVSVPGLNSMIPNITLSDLDQDVNLYYSNSLSVYSEIFNIIENQQLSGEFSQDIATINSFILAMRSKESKVIFFLDRMQTFRMIVAKSIWIKYIKINLQYLQSNLCLLHMWIFAKK